MQLNCTVNGKACCFEIKPNEMLADVLRREGYRGVKIGCREGSCGACSVMFNGKPRNSCITLAFTPWRFFSLRSLGVWEFGSFFAGVATP